MKPRSHFIHNLTKYGNICSDGIEIFGKQTKTWKKNIMSYRNPVTRCDAFGRTEYFIQNK